MSDTEEKIFGTSDMAVLIREKDWESTPLGAVTAWPKALIAAVNMILNAPVAMQMFWGPDLIGIYNDAMLPALQGKHPSALGHPAREVWAEVWNVVGPELEAVQQTGTSVSRSNIFMPLLIDGQMQDHYWDYTYSPLFDGSGAVIGVLNIGLNRTAEVFAEQARQQSDRRRAITEQELRYSREQIQQALDSALLASWYYDPLRQMVGGDLRMQELFDLNGAEATAETWMAVVVDEDRPRVAAEFAASLNGAPYETEFRIAVHGDRLWIRSSAKLLWAGGKLARMVGICEDISRRKEAERILNATVERLALAQQVGNIAGWEWDLQTNRFIWDGQGSWVYGRPPEEVDHIDRILPLIHADDVEDVMQRVEPALRGTGEYEAEFRVYWPDGSHHWLVGRGKPVLDEHGTPVRITGVNFDITERRMAEATVRQTEKLAAVGQLASTIAHEINNPLESVTNLLYICKNSTDDPDLTSYLTTAEIELRRVSAIANQTLRFHKQRTRATEITCEDLFGSSLLIFQGRIQNAGIYVSKRKRAKQPVLCLEGEIRQVMNNLIGNAIDAMKTGGTLTVRSAEGTDWRTGRRGLRLLVADTGTGISPSAMKKLFQAFYTTKGIGGTGLGLWVSHEIVERHKGRLLVRSSTQEGRTGTVFTLFLPFGSL